ncbi:hypothetical protein IAT38_007490 [Cryptococcus sp. DSM 104549]
MTTLKETIVPEKRVRRITVLISGSGTNLQALLDAAGTPRLPSASITTVISSRTNAYGLTRARTHSPPIPTSICALKTFITRNPGATREDYDGEVARRVLESKPDMVVLAGWMHILSDRFLDILNGAREAPPAPALGPPEPKSLPTQTEPLPSNSPTEEGAAEAALAKLSLKDKDAEAPPAAEVTSAPAPAALPSPPLHQHFPIPIINLHPALPGAFDGAHAIERSLEAFQKGEVKCAGVMVHRVVAEVDRGEPLLVREVEIKKEDKLEDLEERIHSVEHEIIVDGARLVLEELDKEERI